MNRDEMAKEKLTGILPEIRCEDSLELACRRQAEREKMEFAPWRRRVLRLYLYGNADTETIEKARGNDE